MTCGLRTVFQASFFISILLAQGCSSRHGSPMVQLFVNGRDIGKVVVLEIPRTVSTQKGFTTETLSSGYHLKLELRAAALIDRIEALNEANSKTRCESPGGSDDLRTAILFYDVDGALVRSVYYGSNPEVGSIDANKCRLNPALNRWVRTQISE